jgi:hypothetical protein
MVLEGLQTEDRPLAVGYFVLDTLRSLYQTGVDPSSPVQMKAGLIDPALLQASVDAGQTHVFLPPLAAVDDLGPLYKLVVAVSRGEKRDL